jgi:hypothetical protein
MVKKETLGITYSFGAIRLHLRVKAAFGDRDASENIVGQARIYDLLLTCFALILSSVGRLILVIHNAANASA